jgi:hypothetical protein
VDRDCIFRNSKLYRKIYVYPDPETNEYEGSILSDAARQARGGNSSIGFTAAHWPWIQYDTTLGEAEPGRAGPHDVDSELVQHSTELWVREVMTHPHSCVRTDDPEAVPSCF